MAAKSAEGKKGIEPKLTGGGGGGGSDGVKRREGAGAAVAGAGAGTVGAGAGREVLCLKRINLYDTTSGKCL
eukprot:3350842-Rhodomonas_salina.1